MSSSSINFANRESMKSIRKLTITYIAMPKNLISLTGRTQSSSNQLIKPFNIWEAIEDLTISADVLKFKASIAES